MRVGGRRRLDMPYRSFSRLKGLDASNEKLFELIPKRRARSVDDGKPPRVSGLSEVVVGWVKLFP